MDNELFYTNIGDSKEEKGLKDLFQKYSFDYSKQIFVLNKPLSLEDETYDYSKACFLLISNYKIIFIDFNNNIDSDEFSDYVEDVLDDIGYISDKYKYKIQLKRPRYWKENLTSKINYRDVNDENIKKILLENIITNEKEKRDLELVISLLTGSINDIERIKGDIPDTILDKIKKRIIIFDGQQSRFLYQEERKKCIKVQGLAGTGKTELLLHKLKNLYIKNPDIKIAFTCYNKILQDTLSKRIPQFFDFMKVEEQIKWNEKLWCSRGWGSKNEPNIGLYSFICQHYNIRFLNYRENNNFSSVCKIALEELSNQKDFEAFFDYILVDECQDFPQEFFELCQKVTKKIVYLAGDIFQNIFNIELETNFDFLLNKCYRTDPRTLMFAHALGMGLFEEKRISWLSKEKLEACGYLVKETDNDYILSRQPLKRFEDFQEEKIKAVDLITSKEENYINKIIEIVRKIKNENLTVHPDDIAVLFLNNNKKNYELAEKLKWSILKEFNWECNIGYETQKRIPGTLLISNKNNVKGLEYPFIVCLADSISDSITERNSIYMILTRSFITSYLILNESQIELITILEKGLREIEIHGTMTIRKATKEEEETILSNILNYNKINSISLDEVINRTMKNNKIEFKYRKTIEELINAKLDLNNYENEEVERIIQEIRPILGSKK